MMTSMLRFAFAASGLAWLASAGAATAADGAISARRFAPLPGSLVVRIDVRDDSRESTAIRDAVARALRERGVRVTTGADATLVLWLDAEVRRNVSGGGSRADFGGTTGMPVDREDPTRRFGAGDAEGSTNLLSTSRDAVVTGRRSSAPGYERALRYVVNAAANEVQGGRRVWQGHVRWDGTGDEPAALLARIAPRLVPHLGASLAETGFDLD